MPTRQTECKACEIALHDYKGKHSRDIERAAEIARQLKECPMRSGKTEPCEKPFEEIGRFNSAFELIST